MRKNTIKDLKCQMVQSYKFMIVIRDSISLHVFNENFLMDIKTMSWRLNMEIKIYDDVSKMGLFDITHNHFFIKDREVWYRDCEREISAFDLARELHENLIADKRCVRSLKGEFLDDDYLGDILLDHLQYGTDNVEGLIAMFYTTLVGAATVREELKKERIENKQLREKMTFVNAITLAAEKENVNLIDGSWYVHIAKCKLNHNNEVVDTTVENIPLMEWYKSIINGDEE